jgi:hypothetical protein
VKLPGSATAIDGGGRKKKGRKSFVWKDFYVAALARGDWHNQGSKEPLEGRAPLIARHGNRWGVRQQGDGSHGVRVRSRLASDTTAVTRTSEGPSQAFLREFSRRSFNPTEGTAGQRNGEKALPAEPSPATHHGKPWWHERRPECQRQHGLDGLFVEGTTSGCSHPASSSHNEPARQTSAGASGSRLEGKPSLAGGCVTPALSSPHLPKAPGGNRRSCLTRSTEWWLYTPTAG